MALRRALLLVAHLTLGAACAAPQAYMTVKVEPINSYRAYGEYHPVSEDEALVKKAATVDPKAVPSRIFQETLPEGIVLNQGTLDVTPGYPHKIIGKYAYSTGEILSKDALVAQVRKMCVVTGANAAVIVFQLVPNDHQDQAQAIEAILVNLREPPTVPERAPGTAL